MTSITGTGNNAVLGLLQLKKTKAIATDGAPASGGYNPSFLLHVNAQTQQAKAAASSATTTASTLTASAASKPVPVIPVGTSFTPVDPNAPSTAQSLSNFLGSLL